MERQAITSAAESPFATEQSMSNEPESASMLSDLKTEGKRQARIAGEKLAEEARRGVKDLKQRARTKAYDGKVELTHQLREVCDVFDRVSMELRSEGKLQIAGLASGMCRLIERATGYLDNRDPEQLLQSIRYTTRNNLASVCTAAFFMGLATARFMKSTPMEGLHGTTEPGYLPRTDTDLGFYEPTKETHLDMGETAGPTLQPGYSPIQNPESGV